MTITVEFEVPNSANIDEFEKVLKHQSSNMPLFLPDTVKVNIISHPPTPEEVSKLFPYEYPRDKKPSLFEGQKVPIG